MREVKLIWDDRDETTEGWFAREYNGDDEYEWLFDADKDADAETLIQINAAKIGTGVEVSIYRSISSSIADETVTV